MCVRAHEGPDMHFLVLPKPQGLVRSLLRQIGHIMYPRNQHKRGSLHISWTTILVTTARRPCSVSWWPFCKYISPFKVCAFWDLMKTKCGRNASSLHYVRLE
jgi:hypothetical protein